MHTASYGLTAPPQILGVSAPPPVVVLAKITLGNRSDSSDHSVRVEPAKAVNIHTLDGATEEGVFFISE